jgi:GNAT superfamily N-acetyltransferase
MTDPYTPFHRSTADLGTCTLLPLGPDSATKISGSLVSMDPWKRLGYRESGLRSYLTRPDPALARYRITRGRELAGVVCIRYPWLGGPFLELIAVLDGFQGQGLGGAILGWMEKEVRGVTSNLWTTASAFNYRALTFYQRHGFVEVTIIEDFLKEGEDEILLRKQVNTLRAPPVGYSGGE